MGGADRLFKSDISLLAHSRMDSLESAFSPPIILFFSRGATSPPEFGPWVGELEFMVANLGHTNFASANKRESLTPASSARARS